VNDELEAYTWRFDGELEAYTGRFDGELEAVNSALSGDKTSMVVLVGEAGVGIDKSPTWADAVVHLLSTFVFSLSQQKQQLHTLIDILQVVTFLYYDYRGEKKWGVNI
jgi:hypothetical protein